MRLPFIVLLILGVFPFCSIDSGNTTLHYYEGKQINGLTFVAPPKPYSEQAMSNIQRINANWISVIPYGYHQKNDPNVKYNLDWQWWGERVEGVTKTIQDAHSSGLQVMLKPQIYIPGGFTGDMTWQTEEQWQIWETSFEKYILHYAHIATIENVAMFCIGTEYKKSVILRPQFWSQLIVKVKQEYKGKLTYASNWDEYELVPFWEQLDFIGVDAYFSLSDEKTPTVKSLQKAWKRPLASMAKFSDKVGKPILFTEYGYLSVDGCCSETWKLEKDLRIRPVNEICQSNAIEALHLSTKSKPWWAGGFLWKWFPNGMGHEGFPAKDYTPQGKLSQKVLQECFRGE